MVSFLLRNITPERRCRAVLLGIVATFILYLLFIFIAEPLHAFAAHALANIPSGGS